MFRNYYKCAHCGQEWVDVWSAQCDDDCPHCGARHMSPYKSEDVEDATELQLMRDALDDLAETFRRINGSCENLTAEDKLAMLRECEDAVFAAVAAGGHGDA